MTSRITRSTVLSYTEFREPARNCPAGEGRGPSGPHRPESRPGGAPPLRNQHPISTHVLVALPLPSKYLVSISICVITPGCARRNTAHSQPATSRTPFSSFWKSDRGSAEGPRGHPRSPPSRKSALGPRFLSLSVSGASWLVLLQCLVPHHGGVG